MPGIKSILQIMRTGAEEARSEAAASLYDVDSERLDCDVLLPFLNDKNEDVRFYVAGNLGRLGHRASNAISSLEKIALNNAESVEVRNKAIYSLAMIGMEAIPSIRQIVARNDVEMTRRVSCSLGPMGDLGEGAADAIDLLLQFVQSPDRETRFNAIESLKQYARNAPKYLQKKATDPSPAVAVPAILAVSYVNKNQNRYSERIVAELKNATDDGALETALIALAYVRVDLSRDLVAVLSRAIESESKEVRYAAVDVACEKFLDDPILREKTESAASDAEWIVASRAIHGLCMRGHYSERFFQLTLKNASSYEIDSDVLTFSILALGNMGAKGAPALDVLRELRSNGEFGEAADVACRLIEKALQE